MNDMRESLCVSICRNVCKDDVFYFAWGYDIISVLIRKFISFPTGDVKSVIVTNALLKTPVNFRLGEYL